MNMNSFETTRYDYNRLKAAVEGNPTQANIDALGEWFSNWGIDYFNGEYYDAENFRIYPVFEEVEEDEFELKGYEIR